MSKIPISLSTGRPDNRYKVVSEVQVWSNGKQLSQPDVEVFATELRLAFNLKLFGAFIHRGGATKAIIRASAYENVVIYVYVCNHSISLALQEALKLSKTPLYSLCSLETKSVKEFTEFQTLLLSES